MRLRSSHFVYRCDILSLRKLACQFRCEFDIRRKRRGYIGVAHIVAVTYRRLGYFSDVGNGSGAVESIGGNGSIFLFHTYYYQSDLNNKQWKVRRTRL